MTNNKNYLFLLTISPVQSFIAQARKTQDLYAGSRILSELVKTGMNEFNFENDIIFPKSTGNSLPNRFIAKFTGTPDQAIEKGKDVKEVIQTEWKKIADDTLEGTSYANGFNEQINQHLDIHWAFEEITDEGYKTAYKNLESLIGAIKNVRPFEQYSYNGIGEQGRKCSIDGQNNALFFGNETRKNLYRKESKWNPNAVLLTQKEAKVSPNEGLSAISFVKRFYKAEKKDFKSFPSTAKVALMQDVEMLKKDVDAKVIYDLYKGFFSRGDFDEQLLFEENLTTGYFDKKGLKKYTSKLSEITKNHARISGFLKQKYYALILFDGDKMGKWLSGDNLIPPYKKEKLEEFHKEFSNLLSKFGEKATKDIHESKYNGKTVYAGGDDYLGFVNLECLFDVMTKLRKDFNELVGSKLKEKGYTEKDITFSAGIVVASYKMPLSEVLKKAREVEKIAKNKADRNAFAISIMKSSGEIQQAAFKWDKDETGVKNWEYIQTITNFLRDEKFSNKFISSLSKELYQLAGIELDSIAEDEENEDLEKAIICEIKRLVKRASSKKTTKSEIKDMQDVVTSLWENAKPTINVNKVENFIHSLHISDFLHRRLNKNN